MLSLEVDAITDDASWAEWEALGDAAARQLPGWLLETVAEQYQERLLERVCGGRLHPVRVAGAVRVPWPGCDVTSDFARKCRRVAAAAAGHQRRGAAVAAGQRDLPGV